MMHDVFDMINGTLNDRKVPIMRFEEKNCAKQHIRSLYVNFGGDIFFVFCLVPSVAPPSSASYYFLCFLVAAFTLTHDGTPIVL